MSKFAGLKLNTEKAFRLFLERPDGLASIDKANKRAYIDIFSTDSRRAREVRDEIQKRRPEGVLMTRDMLVAESNEVLAGMCDGWYLVDFAGNPIEIEFSAANAFEVFADSDCAWIKDQVQAGVQTRAHFIPASGTA